MAVAAMVMVGCAHECRVYASAAPRVCLGFEATVEYQGWEPLIEVEGEWWWCDALGRNGRGRCVKVGERGELVRVRR